jgi:hypothetical protein
MVEVTMRRNAAALAAEGQPPKYIRVYPMTEKHIGLVHYPSGIKIRRDGGDWPNDTFTHRRIREGGLSRTPILDVQAQQAAPQAQLASAPKKASEKKD